MPRSPSLAGANTLAAAPENSSPSALTMSTWTVVASAMAHSDSIHGCSLLQRLRLGDRFLDRADHVEGLLGKRVELAADDALEAADGVLQRHDLAVLPGEDLGDIEGLREEPLHLARTVHGELVLLRQLVHAEDRDDVLQLLVTLQHRLHAARGVVV